jgi:uncharacterized membrane protein YphA (DoxX/SURF4 family)
MPEPKLARAFIVFWWTLGAVIAYLSVHTVVDGITDVPHDLHAILVGGLEAGAAVLFLIPATMRAGAIGLLCIIALAFVVHAAQGHFAAHLLAFAAGVYFVFVHGPVEAAGR